MVARVLYGALFCLVLPILLALWAAHVDVPLPAYGTTELGLVNLIIGAGLLMAGMISLWVRGGGLPMNAFPPPRYVSSGLYELIPHPIYLGFTLICFGASMWLRSAGGLWLVTPAVGLGCAALVLGYESDDLRRRFRDRAMCTWLPPDTNDAPEPLDHIRWLLFVALPLVTIVPILLAGSLLAKTRRAIRSLILRSWVAFIPAVAFDAAPILLAAILITADVNRLLRWTLRSAALALCLQEHWLIAIAIGEFSVHAGGIWDLLRRLAERIANSWTEWRLGRVRIINHAFYGGLAGGAGVFLVAVLTGRVASVAITGLAAVVGAAMWAQWIEGSPRLLRPFGFYGGFFGVIVASLVLPEPWLLMAAYCTASPVAQAIGRLRCLVQGCCHGRPAPEGIGIICSSPSSRVVRLANLGGTPIHPTQLYSILWNFVILLVLAHLWSIGSHLHLIAGLFCILTGIGRFVEEAYRGEPQTPVFSGLRLYQWISIATVAGGAAITALGASAAAPAPQVSWQAAAVGFVFTLLCGFAMGVDFPESDRRFARLT